MCDYSSILPLACTYSVGEILLVVEFDAESLGREEQEVRYVLDKLERGHIVTKNANGNYEISSSALISLAEFFSLYWRPRAGRFGFMTYLLRSKLRTIQWCCIYLGKKGISPDKLSKLLEIDPRTCRRFLERLVRRHQLQSNEYRYKLAKEDEMLDYLISGYQQYRFPKRLIRDYMLEIMLYHEMLSGKEIYEHLKRFGVECHSSTVYNHLRSLKNAKTLLEVTRVKRRAIDEKYYTLNYEDAESYKKELLDQVRETLYRIGIRIEDEFYANALKQKPHSIRVFLRQLMSIATEDEHEDSSCDLWQALVRSLVRKDFYVKVSQFLSTGLKEKREEELRGLVKQHNISPALLSMLLLFQPVKAKRNVSP